MGFFASAFLGDAFPQNFRLGLEIDNQVGWPKLGSKPFEVTVVELQFFVVEIQVGEDLVLLEQKIRQHRPGGFHGERFVQAAVAFHQEIHLRAEGRARLFIVEIGEERIVLAIEDAAGVKALGKDLREGGFADADWTLQDDEPRGPESRTGRLTRSGKPDRAAHPASLWTSSWLPTGDPIGAASRGIITDREARKATGRLAWTGSKKRVLVFRKENGEGPCTPPCFCSVVSLETQARAELYPAGTRIAVGWRELCVDYSEVCRILRIERRIQEVDVVGRVEEIGRELELHAFTDGCDFPEAQIEVHQTKPTQWIVSAMPRIRREQERPEVLERGRRIGEVVQAGTAHTVRTTFGRIAGCAHAV